MVAIAATKIIEKRIFENKRVTSFVVVWLCEDGKGETYNRNVQSSLGVGAGVGVGVGVG